MVDIKGEMPETFTLLNLLEQDVFEISHISTKIEAELDATSKHIHSMVNSMYSLNGDHSNNIQQIVNIVSSCFNIAKTDLSTLKFHAHCIEERRSGITVCLANLLNPDHDKIKPESIEVESMQYSEKLQNKFVRRNDYIDQDNSDTDEYEPGNLCSFIDEIETAKDNNLSLKDEHSHNTIGDNHDNSPKNPLQGSDGPTHSSENITENENEIEVINNADEGCSNENKVVVADDINVSSSGGLENENIVYKDENHEISVVDPVEESYKCAACTKSYATKKKLERHVSSEHAYNDKILVNRCSKRNRGLLKIGAKKPHILDVHPTDHGYFSCSVCNNLYINEKNLKRHKKQMHRNNEKVFTCEKCEKTFNTKLTLKNHLRNHDKVFSCDKCVNTFSTRLKLKNHLRTHNDGLAETGKGEGYINNHTGINLKFPCKLCKKAYSTKTSLKIHVAIIHSKLEPHSCKECGKRFSRLSDLQKHVHIHREKLHQCPHCPEKFTLNANLIYHISKHTGKYPYTCDECGKGFIKRNGWSCHMRFVHKNTGVLPFLCDQCEVMFSDKTGLQRHFNAVHAEKPKQVTENHICEVCAATFKGSQGLWRHSFIHSGTRSHKCPHCPKDFILSTGLARHILTHTGEKPFKCQDCGKCFNQNTNLQIHRRCHTGAKPYVCECGKAFAHRVSLNSHTKSMGGACRLLAKVNT